MDVDTIELINEYDSAFSPVFLGKEALEEIMAPLVSFSAVAGPYKDVVDSLVQTFQSRSVICTVFGDCFKYSEGKGQK